MTLTATFVTTTFLTVPANYNGLFSQGGGVTHESAGFIGFSACLRPRQADECILQQ